MGFWIFVFAVFVIIWASNNINQFITLKKEHNELLREIIRKMDNKTDIEPLG